MKELKVAIMAAKEAGKIHLNYFKNEGLLLKEKNPRDLLTKADVESEKKIISIIKDHFPEHKILAEESGMEKLKSEYLWVIDPLDGTANFFKGHRDFCVLISLVKKKEILLGVTWFPLTQELYVAEKGKGATKNGNPIKVSDESEIEKMYANTQMTSKLENRKQNIKLFSKLILNIRNIHVINTCVARLLTDVAEGINDFHFRIGSNYWDYTAGILLVNEAGGESTELSGKQFIMDSNDVLVSNGKCHKKLLNFINSLHTKN